MAVSEDAMRSVVKYSQGARVIALLLYFLFLQVESVDAESISSEMRELKKQIANKGYIDNEILTFICSAGRGDGSGSAFVKSLADVHALNGTRVVLTFETTRYSISKKELIGVFLGNFGSWAEDIYVTAYTSGIPLDKRVKKGSRVLVSGYLPNNEFGNDFYGNAIDNCFIQFIAKKVELDGF